MRLFNILNIQNRWILWIQVAIDLKILVSILKVPGFLNLVIYRSRIGHKKWIIRIHTDPRIKNLTQVSGLKIKMNQSCLMGCLLNLSSNSSNNWKFKKMSIQATNELQWQIKCVNHKLSNLNSHKYFVLKSLKDQIIFKIKN